jgi:phosphonate transport system substrate-binding protein
MKKLLSLVLVGVMAVSMLTACGANNTANEEAANEVVANETEEVVEEATEEVVEEPAVIAHDKMTIYFVPSREPDAILEATEPLKQLLKDELLTLGYDFGEIDIQVGTSYEAAGEALSAGTAEVAFLPGGTYALYDDGADVILTATRAGLSKDSSVAADWNDGTATEAGTEQVTYYKGLIVAGVSEAGQALAEKVNNGEEITKEDVEGLNWGVRSSTSSSGYIYPTIWLQDNFGLTITDLPNVVQTSSYGDSIAKLALGQIDVCTIYADARRDYAEAWTTEHNRETSIWEETNVIGVTSNIYNDTISVSKSAEMMTPELIEALQNAFINIAGTPEGAEVISIYSHEGYQVAESADYDAERKAQEIIKSME